MTESKDTSSMILDAFTKIEADSDFNTSDKQQEFRKILERSENYPALNGLETTWQLLNAEGDYEALKLRNDDQYQSTPLDQFLYCIEMGFYPPPEVLLAISQCFNYYLSRTGKVELEDVFFSENRKRGVGNHAAQSSKDQFYRSFHTHLQLEKIGAKNTGRNPKNRTEIAEEYLSLINQSAPLETPDPENFLKGFDRWKKPLPKRKDN